MNFSILKWVPTQQNITAKNSDNNSTSTLFGLAILVGSCTLAAIFIYLTSHYLKKCAQTEPAVVHRADGEYDWDSNDGVNGLSDTTSYASN